MAAKTVPQDAAVPQDALAEDFDLDAWIDEARLPERSVTVFGRADLVAELQELEEQLAKVRTSGGDDRLVDPASELQQRVREVEAQRQASARTFRFRALSAAEVRKIRTEAPKDVDGDPEAEYVAAAVLAASCVTPKGMTLDKARAVRAKIGEGQFDSLWQAAWGVSNDRRPDVPFLPAASAVLNNKDS